MSTTRIAIHLRAPREAVYRALLEPRAVQRWMVPDGMTSQVHQFEPRVGGRFRISLTYLTPGGVGKSSARTDTHHGRFVEIVPLEKIVQTTEFETDEPSLQGVMTMTFLLQDAGGGTDLVAVHEHVPPGVPAADNAEGWRLSLRKLAGLVEA